MIEITEELLDQLLEKNARENYRKVHEQQRSRLIKQLISKVKEYLLEKLPGIIFDFKNFDRKLKKLLADGTDFTLNVQARDKSKLILFRNYDS